MNSIDFNALLAQVMDSVAGWGLKVLGALVVFVIGRMIARSARKVLRRALEHGDMDATLIPFVSSLGYYLIMAFVIIAVLGMVGIQTASIIAVLGAAGLAVGLAMQGTLSNFAAGVMLLIFRPFRNGDYIEAGGASGSVKEIRIFSTWLTTPDNVAIVVPNSAVWGTTIKNYTTNPTRRLDLVMSIAYSDDIQTAVDTIRQVLDAESRILADPATVIAVNELAASSVDIVVRPWCTKEDYWELRWDLTRALKEGLENAGCSIPFPQRDVHLFNESASAA